MSELAAACDMSLSGMTRLAGKLESLGYLDRVRCERDARGLEAVLTDAGLARLRRGLAGPPGQRPAAHLRPPVGASTCASWPRR